MYHYHYDPGLTFCLSSGSREAKMTESFLTNTAFVAKGFSQHSIAQNAINRDSPCCSELLSAMPAVVPNDRKVYKREVACGIVAESTTAMRATEGSTWVSAIFEHDGDVATYPIRSTERWSILDQPGTQQPNMPIPGYSPSTWKPNRWLKSASPNR